MSRIGKHPVAVPERRHGRRSRARRSRPRASSARWSRPCRPRSRSPSRTARSTVTPRDEEKRARAMWGMSRSLVQNLVKGVADGFTRQLEISGVGYRAAVDGKVLNLQLGYSHDIKFAMPEDIKIVCETPDGGDRSAGPTSSGSARSPPRSAGSARPSPTRARAEVCRGDVSSARKARRSRPWSQAADRFRAASAPGALRPQGRTARVGCGCPCSARAATSMAR